MDLLEKSLININEKIKLGGYETWLREEEKQTSGKFYQERKS